MEVSPRGPSLKRTEGKLEANKRRTGGKNSDLRTAYIGQLTDKPATKLVSAWIVMVT